MNRKSTLITLLIALAILLIACSQQSASIVQTDQRSPQNPPNTEANLPEGQAPTRLDGETQSGQAGDTATENQPSDRQSPQQVRTSTNYAYNIVDTGQVDCYNDQSSIPCPSEGQAFYGQDAQYQNAQPAYRDNGDGTVTDLNTGLMWQQTPDMNGDGQINVDDKQTYDAASQSVDSFSLAGYNDWRLPTIKELYSLMDFSGITGTKPYIDTNYFGFGYGDESAGERDIDAQFASSTLYVSEVMNGQQAMFGLNLADGRIKGYPISSGPDGQGKLFYVLYVRGDSGYGVNDFVDNGDGTITDQSTGLTWMQADSGTGLNWEEALNYCESLDYAGISDWRLPNSKELQSIVDYTRSPDTTNSAAIDPLFQATLLPEGVNNSGEANYAHYWSSTTHLDGRDLGSRAVYVAFGEARGVMHDQLMDVHGAGAQRSDLKSGDPRTLPIGFGPQGDVQSIYNYARCVTGGTSDDIRMGGDAPQVASTQPEAMVPGHAGPPREAIEACTGLQVDAACTVDTPNGSLTGSCGYTPSGDLACIPEGGPPNRDQGSPPDGEQQP